MAGRPLTSDLLTRTEKCTCCWRLASVNVRTLIKPNKYSSGEYFTTDIMNTKYVFCLWRDNCFLHFVLSVICQDKISHLVDVSAFWYPESVDTNVKSNDRNAHPAFLRHSLKPGEIVSKRQKALFTAWFRRRGFYLRKHRGGPEQNAAFGMCGQGILCEKNKDEFL